MVELMNAPWFRFFPNDWLTGTMGLTATERGVYITLVAMIYDHGGPISRNAHDLHRHCALSKAAFERVLNSLVRQCKILDSDGMLMNSRAQNELHMRDSRVQSAKQAATQRHEKSQENQCVYPAVALRPHSAGNAPELPLQKSDPEPERKKEKIAPRRADLERDFFARGKQVLGTNAGGLLTSLLKAKHQDIALARSALELAATKDDPRQFVAACCKPGNSTGPPLRLLNPPGITGGGYA